MTKKTLFITVLVIVLMFAFIMPVKADTTYGKVEKRTGTGSVTDPEAAEVTVTFSKEDVEALKWVANDQDGIERPENGWWLGFKVTKPEGATADDLKATTMSQDHKFANERDWTGKIFANCVDEDDEDAVSFWVYIDDEILKGKTGEFVLSEYTINWAGKDAQKITVKVDATEAINLKTEGFVNLTIQDTVDNKTISYKVKEGTTLEKALGSDEQNELVNFLTKEGYDFVGLQSKDEKGVYKPVDEKTYTISADTTLYAMYAKITAPTDNETEGKKPAKSDKDNSPKTGVSSVAMLSTFAVATISLAGIAVSRKK